MNDAKFIEDVQGFVFENMDMIQSCITGALDKINVIHLLAQIPAGDRAEFIQHALSLITRHMDGWDQSNVIDALAFVVAQEGKSNVC